MPWGARLSGHDFDLLDWAEALKQPFDPWVDVLERLGERLFVLRSEQFERATSSSEVLAQAECLVARLNGALALERSCGQVITSAVVEYRDNGELGLHVFAKLTGGRMRLRGSAVVLTVGADGATLPPPPPELSASQRWMAAAESTAKVLSAADDRADLVGDLLVHLGRCDNWFDIYKTIEFAELLAGGEHELKKRAGSDAKSIKNARTTANYHRHARAPQPSMPATLDEAKQAARLAARIVLG